MKTYTQFLGEGSLNEENARLNKKVKAELDHYLRTTKPNSPDYQFAIMQVMKGALVDANFHDEAKKLDKFFPKANQSKFAAPEFDVISDSMRDDGEDIARAAKWDGHDIIDAFASYTSMTMGRPFGQKLQSLKEEVVNERKMRGDLQKVLKQKGYEPIFTSIEKSKRDLKRSGYTRGEIQDTLFDMFGDEDPKIVQKIKEDVVNEALTSKDKKAVDAFFDKKDFEGKNVNSDGKTLSTAGLGAQDMFTHTSQGVKMVGKVTGRYDQSLVRYVNKNYKSDLVESVVNEGEKLPKVDVQKVLKQKGYEPIFTSIDNVKRELKRLGYSRDEIQDTLIHHFYDKDPKILKKIKEEVVNEEVLNEKKYLKKYETLSDYEKKAEIGDVIYTTYQSDDVLKRVKSKDYSKVVDKKADGTIIFTQGRSKKRYTFSPQSYDEIVYLIKRQNESVNEGLLREGDRPLSAIAVEIRRDWKNVNYAAKPYLDAMSTLDSINDNYFMDSADSIVRYFLANASTWRGETAKRIKLELKAMLKR